MKKALILLFLLLNIILLSSCQDEEKVISKKYYSTWSVFSGTLNIENKFIWYIEWKEMINLSAKVGWRISNMYVKKWDFVKKWDLLARLDSLEAKVWYWSAENIVDSLLLVKESTSNMFDEQISAMKSKIKQINTWDEWIKIWLENVIKINKAQLETAKIWIDTAKSSLEHTKWILSTKEKNIYDNSKNAIVWSIILDINIINFIDNLLWFTEENKSKNDIFEDYLSVKNTKYLREAKTLFLEVKSKYLDYKEFYDNEIDWKTPTKETILAWLKKWEDLAEKMKNILDLTYNVLDNSIENYYFSLETINNYKTIVSEFWKDIEASLLTVSGEYMLWLKGARQGLIDFEKSSSMQIDLLEKQLYLAEKTYEQYKIANKSTIDEISTKSKTSTFSLNEIYAWLEALKEQKEISLREIDSKILEARWQMNSAWVMIDSWKIISPITWIITQKLAEAWQVISGWMTILVVWDDKNLVLNIEIPETLSKDISLWENVVLEIEWLNKQILWKISNIFSSKNLTTKKVWVEISIKNIWNNIKIWSYTKVIFNNTFKNSSILISNNAILSKFMIPGVYVLENGKAVFKNIKIIKQNDVFSEIKWLNIWDTIIIKWKENIWDGEELK